MTHVLLSGPNGLIGSRIARLHSLNPRPSFQLSTWSRDLDGDVLSLHDIRRALDRRTPTAFLHCAWLKTGTASYDADQANHVWADGTSLLAEECATRGIWFIGLGTCLEHVGPDVNEYTKSKIRLRESLGLLGESLVFTWLRIYWVLEPRLGRPRVLGRWLSAQQNGVPFAPKEPYRSLDFIHADDVASAIEVVLTKQLRGDIDVGSGTLRTVQQLLQPAANSAWPVSDTKGHTPFRGGLRANAAALRQLGWTPSRTDEYFGVVRQ